VTRRTSRATPAEAEAGIVPLTELPAGRECEIVRVDSRHRTRTDRLAAYGVTSGTALTLLQRYPTFVVRVGETDLALDAEVASDILVRPCSSRARPAAAHRPAPAP
jgi:DtxR family transcriptional regulator, Mn-dependent transcriptional regulator